MSRGQSIAKRDHACMPVLAQALEVKLLRKEKKGNTQNS
jgi:hypothetical protein